MAFHWKYYQRNVTISLHYTTIPIKATLVHYYNGIYLYSRDESVNPKLNISVLNNISNADHFINKLIFKHLYRLTIIMLYNLTKNK